MYCNQLKNKINQLEDNRLALFVVCCHVDKLLTEDIPSSKYDVFIQAGAALTDKRVCEINDMDELADNISDRNQRYSEMSAMYYAGKTISTDYVGVTHYRRRFLISDEELSKRMDDGFDILTTIPCKTEGTIKEKYINDHYKKDWELFMDILGEYSPEDIKLAEELFNKDVFHPGNIGIYSAAVYKDYCEWMFPMLDAFYRRSPWKLDIYQRRDVGFIGERLTNLYVEKMVRQGKKVIEVPFKDYKSNEWVPEDECNLSDVDAVLKACDKYYEKNDILKCRRLVASSLSNIGINNPKIRGLAYMFKAGIEEQKYLAETMFEYLPDEWKKTLDTLLQAYQGLGNIIQALAMNPNAEIENMFRELISMTHFSWVIVESHCNNLKLDSNTKERIMSYLK